MKAQQVKLPQPVASEIGQDQGGDVTTLDRKRKVFSALSTQRETLLFYRSCPWLCHVELDFPHAADERWTVQFWLIQFILTDSIYKK